MPKSISVLLVSCAFSVCLPGAGLAQSLPVRGGDLTSNQLFHTFIHLAGIQGEGHDIGGRRRFSNSAWFELTQDLVDAKVLTNWVAYGKPVYAMAAGTVVGCWRNAPDNVPGSFHADYDKKKFAGGGNHLWILQANGVYALYAHLKPGSIPPVLCPNNAILFAGTANGTGTHPDIEKEVTVTGGAVIAQGQQLGAIGNSGESKGGPHLHVHMEKDGKPVVINFDRGMTTPFATNWASLDGPWTRLAGKPLPKATILFWPPRPVGNYTFNATRVEEYGRLFAHMSDSGMMPDQITCTSGGLTYNVNWVPAAGQWLSHNRMSAAEAVTLNDTYTKQGFKRTSSYTCGGITAAVWRK